MKKKKGVYTVFKKIRLFSVSFLCAFLLLNSSGVNVFASVGNQRVSHNMQMQEVLKEERIEEDTEMQSKKADVETEENYTEEAKKVLETSLDEHLGNEPPIISINEDGSAVNVITGEKIDSSRVQPIHGLDYLEVEIWVLDEATGTYLQKKIGNLTEAERNKYADEIERLKTPSFFASAPYVTIGGYSGYSLQVTDTSGRTLWSANYQAFLVDGEHAFCVQPGYELIPGGGFVPSLYELKKLDIIWYEGWIQSNKTMNDYIATQWLMWEELGATVVSSFNAYPTYKAAILDRIKHHSDVPSFENESYELNVGETIRIHDKNNVLNKFHIYSTDGLNVKIEGDDLVITGTANAKDNSRIIFEKFDSIYVMAPIIFQKPGSQSVAKFGLYDPLSISISVKVNKQGTITLHKEDSVTGMTAQGNASLLGWEFGVYTDYEKTNKVDTLIGAEVNEARSKLLNFDTYYIWEDVVPEGYTLAEEPIIVTLDENNMDISIAFPDRVKSQAYQLIKVSTDGTSGELTPVKGAEITTKLLSDVQLYGWDNAPVAKNANGKTGSTLVTDEYGRGISDRYPYGVYLCRETLTPNGLLPIPDFIVNVTEDSDEPQVWRVFNDAPLKAYVKLIKRDAETGNIIPVSDFGFKLKNVDTGEYVKMKVTYPYPHEIEIFKTGNDGTLLTPEMLYAGNYQWEEAYAGNGYTLNLDPIPFSIDNNGIYQIIDGDPVLTVDVYNQQQLGKLTIEKQGDIFKGFDFRMTEHGMLYEPIFERDYLDGVTYELVARKDIVTADGTVWYHKGDVINMQTSVDGKPLTFDGLRLGGYEYTETYTKDGFVIDKKTYPVDIEYAGQEVTIVQKTEHRINERQRGYIEFEKIFDESLFYDEEDFREDVLYGVYTANPLIINGVEEVPADSLLSVGKLDELNKGKMFVDFEGRYYLQEITTHGNLILDDTKHYFTFAFHEDNTEETKLVFEDGISVFENHLKTGSLLIHKVDGNKEPLAGAEIAVSSTFDFSNIVASGITKEDGVLLFDNLECGEYWVKEINAPEGFQLDLKVHHIHIDEEGQVVELEIVNQKIQVPITADFTNANIFLFSMFVIALLMVALSRKDHRDC